MLKNHYCLIIVYYIFNFNVEVSIRFHFMREWANQICALQFSLSDLEIDGTCMSLKIQLQSSSCRYQKYNLIKHGKIFNASSTKEFFNPFY